MTLINRILGRRGLGCKPDAPDSRDQRFGALALPSIGLPDSSSMRDLVPEVFDQSDTQSCVAHAVCQAYRLARIANALRVAAPLPSRKFVYYHARAYTGDERDDGGTYTRNAIKALKAFGAPPESAWPWASPINRRPSWAADRAGHDSRGVEGYYRIFDVGSARVSAVRAAIAANHPVVFGTLVTQSFLSLDGPSVVGLPGKESIAGRHALLIVGYQQTSDGMRFQAVNSWGPTWRDKGFCWFTEDYIRWSESSDFQVLKLAS